MSFNYQEFKEKLISEIDEDYREFVARGIITDYPLLGVRIPKLRALAKEIVKTGGAKEFFKHEPGTFEEVTVRGLVVANLPYEEMISSLDEALRFIDNWESCDVFSAELKRVIRPRKEEFLESVVEKLIESPKEFYARAGLVILLTSYVEFDYLFYLFETVDSMREREEYYVKMATAWLVQGIFVKFPEETFAYLEKSKLPKWTLNRAISKITDSYRVDPETKAKVKLLRRK